MKNPRQNTVALIKELFKHARRDGCYECKQLLKAMGLDSTKSFDETFKREKTEPNTPTQNTKKQ